MTAKAASGVFWTVVFISLQAVACFRSFDASKLNCSKNEGCPSDHYCSAGKCLRGVSPLDGGVDTLATHPPDSSSERGSSSGGMDGATREVGGATGAIDSPALGGMTTGGQTSTGGASGGASGGSGGAVTLDAKGDAPAGPDAIDAPAGMANGTPCAADGKCASTYCIDGVCCATACAGCNACAAAQTGAADGTCAPVAAGKDPHEACTDETTTKPCGNDGTCDGKGACRKVAANQKCGEASCSADGNTFTPEPRCDGNGACAASIAQTCAPYPCAVTGCARTCATQADCDAGTYCDTATGTCAAQKTNGAPATQTYECVSAIVADGVCCSAACTDPCRACNLSGSRGTCTRVGSGQPVAGHGSCANAGTTCGGSCDGTKDTCSYPGSAVSCGAAASCSGKVYQAPGACAGDGACSTPMAATCPYVCNPSQGGCIGICNPGDLRCFDGNRQECSTSGTWQNNACPVVLVCSGAGSCGCAAGTTACGSTCCTSSQYCSGTTCLAKHATGSCASSTECTTGYCVGGYCCSSSTCGVGQTCTSGSCGCPFTLNTLPDREMPVAPARCTPLTVEPSPPSESYEIKWFLGGTEVPYGNPINPGTSTLEFSCSCIYAGTYHAEVTLNGCTARSNDARVRFLCLDGTTYCGEAGLPASCP